MLACCDDDEDVDADEDWGGDGDGDEDEAGMAEMSKVYDETGRELYMGAGDRERD